MRNGVKLNRSDNTQASCELDWARLNALVQLYRTFTRGLKSKTQIRETYSESRPVDARDRAYTYEIPPRILGHAASTYHGGRNSRAAKKWRDVLHGILRSHHDAVVTPPRAVMQFDVAVQP